MTMKALTQTASDARREKKRKRDREQKRAKRAAERERIMKQFDTPELNALVERFMALGGHPLTERALLRRINRVLAKYYVVDVSQNLVLWTDVHLEGMVLRAQERVECAL